VIRTQTAEKSGRCFLAKLSTVAKMPKLRKRKREKEQIVCV